MCEWEKHKRAQLEPKSNKGSLEALANQNQTNPFWSETPEEHVLRDLLPTKLIPFVKVSETGKMESSSPQEDPTLLGYRGRSQTKFLPLNSDDALTFSTRGQNLQSVMMAQSQQRKFSMSYKRRPTVDPEARDEEEGPNTPARSLSAEREGDRVKERRMSSGAKILMTPEMRSKRLIGSSNPRYQWFVL